MQSSPQHTITLASSKTAIVVYLRNENARKATELAIRNGAMKFLELSEDILTIIAFDHALGWPYREHAIPDVVASGARFEEVDVPVLIHAHNPYGVPFWDDSASVLGDGPMKEEKHFPLEVKEGTILGAPKKIGVLANRTDSLYPFLHVYLKDDDSSRRLFERLSEGGNIVLTLNEVVRAILLVPHADIGASLLGYGLENLPNEDMAKLQEIGIHKLPSGVWTAPAFSSKDYTAIP